MHKVAAIALIVCGLTVACADQVDQQRETQPSSRSTPPSAQTPQPPNPPQPQTTGPLPGGAYDCYSGRWAWVLDYRTMSGQVGQGATATAFCESELRALAYSGSLFLDNEGRSIPNDSQIVYSMPLSALDGDAQACQKVYGQDCLYQR